MSAVSQWPFPGVLWGEYPEQAPEPAKRERRVPASRRVLERFADAVAAAPRVSAEAFGSRLERLPSLAKDPHAWLHEAMLLAASALAGQGFPPHRQQLLAARVLLEDRLAEMATGEGKTAAIAMAAAVAALGRTPVHVVTANDYLAQRDADALRPFYERLGLHVDCVTQPMLAARRREAYAADVTYCTAKELAFDYLRDSLGRETDLSALEQRARRIGPGRQAHAPVLRGLCMAILDEADTVLIDEARVPLVLAQPEGLPQESAFHEQALRAARSLAPGQDYVRLGNGRRFELTPRGRQRLVTWPVADHPLLGHRAHREAAVEMALVALLVLRRDHEYVVRDGEVILIDETTGRPAEGRAWSSGLHQLVEWKEGVSATRRNSTVTQITFQRFFPRYLRLAGASGTLGEARGELRQVYGLRVEVIPPRTASRMDHRPPLLLPDSDALWRAVADEAKRLAGEGRAVLIGTDTVAQSEALSERLARESLPHRVLNARQDRGESELIAAAGQPGQVTVATSMAGRGTDIACHPQVLERGGLHVILCQVNASARIDRQFLGRAGRQGQPGSVQRMVAADFALLQKWWPRWWLERLPANNTLLANVTIGTAQRQESFTQRKDRVKLCQLAAHEERDLTFSRQVTT
ncbi:MAG: prepilin peptidase [Ramlibacter sp.]|jgi:preprotein translocase subunit SecA|nr:prepilin peptidase [Ramlibacter sp.]